MVRVPFQNLDFGQVQVQIQLEQPTAQSMQLHQEREEARIRQQLRDADSIEKSVVIVDGSVDLMPPADVRKLQAEWIKQHDDLLRIACHSMGFVVPGTFARGAMTAILWMAPVPVPTTTHANMEAALTWAMAEVDSIAGHYDPALVRGGAALIADRKRQVLSSLGPTH